MDSLTIRPVVMVLSHLAPTLGMERVALSLIEALGERADMEVVVIGGDGRDESLTELPAHVLGAPLRGKRRLFAAWRILRARRHFSGKCVVLVGAWAAIPALLVMPRSCRIVVWEHSLIGENMAASRSLRFLRAAAAILYRRAAVIVAVSEPLAIDLRALRLGEVVAIPNLVDLPESPMKLERRSGQLCMLGTLSQIKNQARAIEALELLPEDYSLVIVGEGPSRTALQERAEQLHVGDRVQFTGFQRREVALDILARSEALLHTSRGETFGLAYLEAAALGTPVVAVTNRLVEQWTDLGLPIVTTEDRSDAIADAVRGLRSRGPVNAWTHPSWRSLFDSEDVVARWLETLAVVSAGEVR